MNDDFPINCFSMSRGYIRLVQHGLNEFSVHYGAQVDADLTYANAADANAAPSTTTPAASPERSAMRC